MKEYGGSLFFAHVLPSASPMHRDGFFPSEHSLPLPVPVPPADSPRRQRVWSSEVNKAQCQRWAVGFLLVFHSLPGGTGLSRTVSADWPDHIPFQELPYVFLVNAHDLWYPGASVVCFPPFLA